MGTNVYFYRKLNQKQLEEIRNTITQIDNLPDLQEYVNNLPYPENKLIHVGKHSLGWEFIFSEDVFDLCGKEQISENSIIEFLSTGELVTEYGEHITIGKFWANYIDACKGGYTKDSYFREHPEYRSICRYDFYMNGFNFEEGEFS